MDHAPDLALNERWWVERRHQPAVQSALLTAHMRHWRPRVQEALDVNKQFNREPSTWSKLAALLAMGEPNFWRLRSGKQNNTVQHFLAMASILQLPMEQMIPDPQTWIAEATFILCDGIAASEEARAYAIYRLSGPAAHNPHLDRTALACVCKSVPGLADLRAAEQAVYKTASILGNHLLRSGVNQ